MAEFYALLRYESYTTGDDSSQQIASAGYSAQTFTPVNTHWCRRVTVKVYSETVSGRLNAAIYAVDASGAPTGPILASGSISNVAIRSGYGATSAATATLVPIKFDSPVEVSGGIEYAIVCWETGCSTTFPYWRYDNTDGAYSRGQRWRSTNRGITWSVQTGDDHLFEEWGGLEPMVQCSTLRHDIARIVEGPDFIIGTVDSGTTTTIVDALELTAADNTYKGRQVYIYYDAGGASAAPEGEKGRISASDQSDTNITFPALTIAPAAGDLYEVHTKGLIVADYNEAINAAHRAARFRHKLLKVDESLMFSNLLSNGAFELWDSYGADTAVATGWAKSSAELSNRETSLIWGKKYSMKLVTVSGDSYGGSLSQSVANYARHRGKSATAKAWVFTSATSRVRLKLTDGVNTWYSDYHDGEGWPGYNGDPLEVENKTIADNPTQLTVSIEIATHASVAVTVRIGRVELKCGSVDVAADYIWEYTVPSGFIAISEVWQESSVHNEYDFLLPDKWWYIKPDSTRKLVFDKRFWTPEPGYRMLIKGQKKATEPTADTSTIELNEEYVKAYAVWQLLLRDMSTEEKRAKASYWGALAQDLWRRLDTPWLVNSKMVEVM